MEWFFCVNLNSGKCQQTNSTLAAHQMGLLHCDPSALPEPNHTIMLTALRSLASQSAFLLMASPLDCQKMAHTILEEA